MLNVTASARRVFLALPLTIGIAQAGLGQSTFHGDNSRSGVFAAPGPQQFGGIKWKFKTNGAVVSSPAAADGVIYVGSADGNLYALDQETGAQKWKFDTGEPVVSSPAVANGLVYFLGSDGALYAVMVATGAPKWRFATGGERRFEARNLHGLTPAAETMPDPMDHFLSSPAVFNNRVYFGSSDGKVYAVDAVTGVLQWSFATGDVVHASPAIANNTVYIGSWDSYFYALDAATGQEKWRFKAGDDPAIHNQVGFQSSAAVVAGVVYVGCRDGHAYALDAVTGRKIWDYSTSQSWVNSTPAVKDGLVFFGTADTHRFHAVEAKTGRLRFVVDVQALIFGSAAVAGNLAYIGSMNGRMSAIDITTGKLAWEFRTEASTTDPLHVLTPSGTFDRPAMRPVFHNFMDMTMNLSRMYSVGAILSSPMIDRGVLYVGSADGYLYALH
jgi:eukaryotic-like serine/threonine-protein kinase